MRVRLPHLLLCLFVVACAPYRAAPPPVAASRAAGPMPAVDTAIYDAVTTLLFNGKVPDTLVVSDSTEEVRAPVQAADSAAQPRRHAIPPALLEALALASRRQVASTSLPLPRPVVALGDAELAALFRGGTEAGWHAFHTRYPRARYILSFSPVVVSADGLQALVYASYSCGGLCGQGTLIWLVRNAAGGWVPRGTDVLWVS